MPKRNIIIHLPGKDDVGPADAEVANLASRCRTNSGHTMGLETAAVAAAAAVVVLAVVVTSVVISVGAAVTLAAVGVLRICCAG